MCAGGLQLLDPMSAAILIQYLQQMPLAPLTGSKVAMYMGNMNGAVPPQYAACNGTEDQASSHIVLMNMLMVTKLECCGFQGAFDIIVGTGQGDIRSAAAGLVVCAYLQPRDISVRQDSTPAARLPEPQLLAVTPAVERMHGRKAQRSRPSAANKQVQPVSSSHFVDPGSSGI